MDNDPRLEKEILMVGVTGLEPVTPSLSSWGPKVSSPQGMGDSEVLADLLGRVLGQSPADPATVRSPRALAADLLRAAEVAVDARPLIAAARALLAAEVDAEEDDQEATG